MIEKHNYLLAREVIYTSCKTDPIFTEALPTSFSGILEDIILNYHISPSYNGL